MIQIFYYITVMGSCSSMNGDNLVVHPSNFQGMQIVCKSWKKTYSNLFDYTAQGNMIETKIFTISQQTRMHKHKGQYLLVPYEERDKYKNTEVQATADVLIASEKKKGNGNQQQKVFTFVSKNDKLKQQPWIVVKSLPLKRYMIKQGDMLRIGKQKVRVKQIIQRSEQIRQQDQQITTKGHVYQNLTKEGKPIDISGEQINNYICRFCLDSADIGHPLMAPCNCAGSSKYVHLKCVQTWLTKTINPRTVGKSTVITWKPLVCQLCHKTLPFKVYLDGKRYFTVNIPKPKKPYLVLNPIFREKQPSKSKIYYLVSFAQNKEMIIGRKGDSDIIISEDSTVSRHHSKIIFSNTKNQSGNFFIMDNQSKFGTLVLLRKEFQMKQELNNVCIQLGGDVLQLKIGARAISNEATAYQDIINKSQSDSSDDYQQQQEEGGNEGEPGTNNQIQNGNNELSPQPRYQSINAGSTQPIPESQKPVQPNRTD